MPASRGGKARPRVQFDEISFAVDVSHATAAGRRVAIDARRDLERDGVDVALLLSCQPHGRDGTRLPRCVKLYLPPPVGGWRMVFEITRDRSSGDLVLAYLAFGLGHPRSHGSPRPTGSPTSDCTPTDSRATTCAPSSAAVCCPPCPCPWQQEPSIVSGHIRDTL